MSSQPKILIILTSSEHGWYLPELAHPYEILSPSCDVTIASPLGGVAPLDQSSIKTFGEDEVCVRFVQQHRSLWENTAKLESFLGKADEFAAILYVGGYGPIFDLPQLEANQKLVLEFHASNKVLASVCHGSAVFSNIKLPGTDTFLLEGHKVTGVSDHEIATLARPLVEPFSVEKSLHAATGGKYEKAEKPFEDYVVTSKGDDGRVIVTGQNPASGLEFGRAVWEAIFGEKYEA